MSFCFDSFSVPSASLWQRSVRHAFGLLDGWKPARDDGDLFDSTLQVRARYRCGPACGSRDTLPQQATQTFHFVPSLFAACGPCARVGCGTVEHGWRRQLVLGELFAGEALLEVGAGVEGAFVGFLGFAEAVDGGADCLFPDRSASAGSVCLFRVLRRRLLNRNSRKSYLLGNGRM